jgi:hypothetical protein
MILKAESLSQAQKTAIEQILGRRILQAEAISLRTFEPEALTTQKRVEIVAALHQCLDSGQIESRPREISEEIITEAMREVRPSYRPLP